MIPRYSPPDVAALFADVNRFDTMLEVEILAAEALAKEGVLPAREVAALRSRRPVVDEKFVPRSTNVNWSPITIRPRR